MTPHISANTKRLTGVKEMDKEVIAALRRIRTVAHYALENEVARPDSDVADSFNYIIEEVTDALNEEQDQ